MSKVVVMDFFAEWCGPCKLQDPILEKLKERFKDDISVEFKKIDVDDDIDGSFKLVKKYSIRAVPTLIIEKNDEFLTKYVGVTKLETLEKKIKEALE